MTVELAPGAFSAVDAEAFVRVFTPGRWITGAAGKEVFVGLIEIFQRLLLGGLGDAFDPTEFVSQIGQLPALRGEAEVSSFAAEMAALKKGGVVDGAANAGPLRESLLLNVCRIEPVSIAALYDHSAFMLCSSCGKSRFNREIVVSRVLPGLKSGASALNFG